jgi:hypothetical protein
MKEMQNFEQVQGGMKQLNCPNEEVVDGGVMKVILI